MKLWRSLQGKMDLAVTCADTVGLLNLLSSTGIVLHDAVYQGDLVLYITIYRVDYQQVNKICEKKGADVKIIGKKGLYWYLVQLRKRPVIVTFLVLIIFAGIFLPSRVLFIQVKGNVSIPANQILEAASVCGIGFGASRRAVRSEAMKNALLQEIPNIQWAGVNTVGCTAIISVKEKTIQAVPEKPANMVCSIVASRDGVIQNITVLEGNPLCTVGQAVKKGQTLVSGYLDCGLVVKTSSANAEVNALTFRELDVLSPYATRKKGECCGKTVRYSLRVGKKVINLYKDSGILGGTCDKIYSEEYVVLPGGFILPISVIRETVTYYTDAQLTASKEESKEWLYDATGEHLQSQMIAGQIISSETKLNYENDAAYFHGQYACMEMIGQIKYEDTLLKDEKND